MVFLSKCEKCKESDIYILHTRLLIFKIRTVVFIQALGYQETEFLGQSLSHTFGKGKSDLLIQGSDYEGLLGL